MDVNCGCYLFCFILPQIEKCYNKERNNMLEKFNTLSNCNKMDLNICSPACCGKQWPTGIDLSDPAVKDSELLNKYVPSNYTCSGNGIGQGPGCVCIPKREKQFLSDRGGNTRVFNLDNLDKLEKK